VISERHFHENHPPATLSASYSLGQLLSRPATLSASYSLGQLLASRFTLCFFCLTLGFFEFSVSGYDRPEIVVPIPSSNEVSVDLGELCFEERLECGLKLRNETDLELDINVIQSGCGCVQSALTKSVALKGESLDLDVIVRPKDIGSFRQVLFLKSSRESGGVKVILSGSVRRRIQIGMVDRATCRDFGRFVTNIELSFGTDLDGAVVVSDPFSEFDLELKRSEGGFVLAGLVRKKMELWPKSGFSEVVVFKLADGSLMSSYLAVAQSFVEMVVPTRLKVTKGQCRVTLLSPEAADVKYGSHLRVVDVSGEVIAKGDVVRRS
jgi:hypothetical protein